MKEKVSIVKLVFGRIIEIWRTIPVEEVAYTTDNMHKSIFEKLVGNSESAFQMCGKRKHLYNAI